MGNLLTFSVGNLYLGWSIGSQVPSYNSKLFCEIFPEKMFHINSSNGSDLSWFVLFFEAVLILSILNLLIFCWWIIVNEHRQTPCHMQSKDVQWRLQPFDGLLPRHTSLGYRRWNAPKSLTYVLELSNFSKIYGYQFYNNVWVYKANKNSYFRLSQGFSQGAVQLGDCGMESSPSWLSGGKYISLNTLASFRNNFPIPATSRSRLLARRDCSDEPGLRYDIVQKYVKQVMLQQEHKNQGACHYRWHHRDGGPCLADLQWDVEREVAPAKWTLIPWN